MPQPIPKPERPRRSLPAALEVARYPAGSTVTLLMIAEVGGVNEFFFDGGEYPALGVFGGPLGVRDGKRVLPSQVKAGRSVAADGFGLVVDCRRIGPTRLTWPYRNLIKDETGREGHPCRSKPNRSSDPTCFACRSWASTCPSRSPSDVRSW